MAEPLQHKPWIKLVYARDGIEASLIQSFLEGEGIETLQPHGRYAAYDAGYGPGIAGEPGVRIDVPEEQHALAMTLLNERRKDVASGALRIDELPSTETSLPPDAAIEQHSPSQSSSPQVDHALLFGMLGLGIVALMTGVSLWFDAGERFSYQQREMKSAGMFITIIGGVLVALGMRYWSKPWTKAAPTSDQPENVGPSLLFRAGLVLMFLWTIVLPLLVVFNGMTSYMTDANFTGPGLALVAIPHAVLCGYLWLLTLRGIVARSIDRERHARIIIRLFFIGNFLMPLWLPVLLCINRAFGEGSVFFGVVGGLLSLLLLWVWKHMLAGQRIDVGHEVKAKA